VTQRIVIFVGPSLPADEVQRAIARIPAEVIVQPPVQQGDMLRIAELKPTCVAIVDGVFFQVPSVTHKEILFTLERGVRVLGAASLGALRAAELDVFGMQGVGEIYRMYKHGIIDGDDEVAVMHGNAEDGYVAYSEPLVSVRHNLRRAQHRGIISGKTARSVIQAGKQLHFTRRTYRGILRAAVATVPEAEMQALERFLDAEAEDLKRADALELLELLATEPSASASSVPTVHRTVYAHLAHREYAGRTYGGSYLSDAFVLSMVKLLSPRAVRLRRRAAFRCIASAQATAACSTRQLINEVAQRHGIEPRLLLTAPRMQPGIPWDTALLREAADSGEFEAMLELAARVQCFAETTRNAMPGLLESLSLERLEAWAANKWAIEHHRLGRHLVLRGFSSYREFADVARLVYVEEWLNDAAFAQQDRLERVVRAAGVALEVR